MLLFFFLWCMNRQENANMQMQTYDSKLRVKEKNVALFDRGENLVPPVTQKMFYFY